jgi:hypothetical protein
MNRHEMQHPNSPTWCIRCGTFDIYCGSTECVSTLAYRQFDMKEPANWRRTLVSVFGPRGCWPAGRLSVRETPDAQGVSSKTKC